MELSEDDVCIRCGGRMVHVGFKIYRCERCGMKKSQKT
jgi:tRNA(Ile2) C34 agmatinyltransferase TiaS